MIGQTGFWIPEAKRSSQSLVKATQPTKYAPEVRDAVEGHEHRNNQRPAAHFPLRELRRHDCQVAQAWETAAKACQAR
jgi:hypothetical protein